MRRNLEWVECIFSWMKLQNFLKKPISFQNSEIWPNVVYQDVTNIKHKHGQVHYSNKAISYSIQIFTLNRSINNSYINKVNYSGIKTLSLMSVAPIRSCSEKPNTSEKPAPFSLSEHTALFLTSPLSDWQSTEYVPIQVLFTICRRAHGKFHLQHPPILSSSQVKWVSGYWRTGNCWMYAETFARTW